MNKTAFYQNHLDAQAKMVDFGAWILPLHYGSQIKEHEAVRNSVGMFDVSHMLITDIHGVDAKPFMRYLISNDVVRLDKFGVGKALYSAMLNLEAHVLDDLIVYLMPFGYRIVSNAATEAKDLAWFKQLKTKFKIEIFTRRDLAMLAVQGPEAINYVSQACSYLENQLHNLKPFSALSANGYFFARTGYTGEHGLEIMLPLKEANDFWHLMLKVGVKPCGLGARDTLRLEAGMNLYGHDMDETVSPLACGMDWVVDLSDTSRDFIGKDAYLLEKRAANHSRQAGLILEARGVLREGYKIFARDREIGIVTSGSFSPSLKCSIAIARINMESNHVLDDLRVLIRGEYLPVTQVKLPFIKNGKKIKIV